MLAPQGPSSITAVAELVVVKFNGAALHPNIPRNILKCSTIRKKCNTQHCMKHPLDIHALYIDDLSEAEAINLKKDLVSDPVQRQAPLTFNERTQKILY